MSLPIVTPSPLPALMPGAEAAAEVAAEDTIAAVATEAPLATQEMTEKEETEAYQKSMEFIFEVVLLSFVGVLGIVGNLVLIVLFSFQKVQMKFHRLMMLLAFYDMVYIVLSLLLFTVPQVSPEYKSSGWHYRVLPKALPLAQITLTGSIYSTLAITIERYITVCHPFYAVSHKWSARRYLVPIISFSLFYNAPKFFELSTAREENVNSTTNNYTIEPTAMRVNEIYIKVYCIWMNFVFMGLGPFCLLIGLNALTLRTLLVQTKGSAAAAASNLPPSYSQSKKSEIALAKVSLAIVFVFILCHSVKWIPNLYELARLAREDKRAWPPWVESTTHISHFLMTVNSSVNFYIYCFKHYAGGRLRWLLPCCCFFCCCGNKEDNGNSAAAITVTTEMGVGGGGGERSRRGSLMADFRFKLNRGGNGRRGSGGGMLRNPSPLTFATTELLTPLPTAKNNGESSNGGGGGGSNGLSPDGGVTQPLLGSNAHPRDSREVGGEDGVKSPPVGNGRTAADS